MEMRWRVFGVATVSHVPDDGTAGYPRTDLDAFGQPVAETVVGTGGVVVEVEIEAAAAVVVADLCHATVGADPIAHKTDGAGRGGEDRSQLVGKDVDALVGPAFGTWSSKTGRLGGDTVDRKDDGCVHKRWRWRIGCDRPVFAGWVRLDGIRFGGG